jgi:hypothetical protein
MAAFMLQTVRSMACSVTKTHLLPRTRCALVSGVRAATSSSVIRFDPAPSSIWLKATHSMVYHAAPNRINPSSSWRFRIPTRCTRPALYDPSQLWSKDVGVGGRYTDSRSVTSSIPTPYKLHDSGTKPGLGFDMMTTYGCGSSDVQRREERWTICRNRRSIGQ